MSVSDLRFKTTKEVDRVVRACQLTNVVRAQDERGHYLKSFDAPDWFKALPAETIRVENGKTVVTPPARRGGITGEIRTWVQANPEATREDALRQFSHYNPSTVKVQYTKARQG